MNPRTIDDIDTPAVLIDLDIALANIARAQAQADAAGVRLRPHIKTHKLPYFAKKQVEAGAAGITCQKIGEAEVIGRDEPFAYEKLSPVLALYRAKDFADAVAKAAALVEFGGIGHTSVPPRAHRALSSSALVVCGTMRRALMLSRTASYKSFSPM